MEYTAVAIGGHPCVLDSTYYPIGKELQNHTNHHLVA